MEWSEFALRLGRELASLERDTILIVRELTESRHYVQAMREPDRLYSEAVSNNFLDGALLLTPADEEVMADAGWRPPADPAPRNWWTELPPFAAIADHMRLAEMMITALRDVQAVRRPSDLVYESFHRQGTGLIELIDFGIDIADPARISERRASATPPDDGMLRYDPPPPEPVPAAAPVDDRGLPQPSAPGFEPAAGLEPAAGFETDADTDAGAADSGANALRRGGRRRRAAPPPAVGELESRLAEAKQQGDHVTYFELILGMDLLLPSAGGPVHDPAPAEFATTVLGDTTYVLVFTSKEAMAQSMGSAPGQYRRMTFARLAQNWPDPEWSLIINAGLPSGTDLDWAAIARLDDIRRTAEQAAASDTVQTQPAPQQPQQPQNGPARVEPQPPPPPPPQPEAERFVAPEPAPEPVAPPAPPAEPRPHVRPEPVTAQATDPRQRPQAAPPPPEPAAEGQVPIRPPHGTGLWFQDGPEPGAATIISVYDAVSRSWTPTRTG